MSTPPSLRPPASPDGEQDHHDGDSDQEPYKRPCGDVHCANSECLQNTDVGFRESLATMMIWAKAGWFPITKRILFREGEYGFVRFYFSQDLHLQHMFTAGQNQQVPFEWYSLEHRDWIALGQRDYLEYQDFNLSHLILMRVAGISDNECMSISTFVSKCHEGAWKKSGEMITVPHRYTHHELCM